MELRLARSAGEASRPCRTVRADDVDSLSVLLYAAFRGTIDDEGESFADALAEIERTFAGGYGKLLTNCSFVAEKGEFLVSACLIGLSEPGPVPLVIFSMTRPDAHVTVGAVSCCADRSMPSSNAGTPVYACSSPRATSRPRHCTYHSASSRFHRPEPPNRCP